MGRVQINRFSGKVLILLSVTALVAALSGYIWPPPPDEGAASRLARTGDLTFPGHQRLETAFANRTTIGNSSHRVASRIWSPILP